MNARPRSSSLESQPRRRLRIQFAINLLLSGVAVALLLTSCQRRPRWGTVLPRTGNAAQSLRPGSFEPTALPSRVWAELAEWRSGADEIWIISKPKPSKSGQDTDTPTSGRLLARFGDQQTALPLQAIQVQAKASGDVVTVDYQQRYRNPYPDPIETVYVFPLPENAAVNDFTMTIGDRRIRGVVRERTEAEALYAEAKQQGYTASLLTQERPNVFTQSIANIQPGKDIEVSLRYLNTLTYSEGWHELVIPLVVGPRFTPTAAKATAGSREGFRSQNPPNPAPVAVLTTEGADEPQPNVSIQLEVAGAMEQQECPSHRLEEQSPSPILHRFKLSAERELPNRDFVFRYRMAGETIKSHVQTVRVQDDGFFRLTLYPPQQWTPTAVTPLELVFVLDCSGSMSGRPLAQAKDAIAHALKNLHPEDTFQIITFSMKASQFGSAPLPATPVQIRRGLNYLNSLRTEGGTFMIEGIKAALRFPHDPQRLRFVCFLTDGFIGNESEILHEVASQIGDSRIFSYGVGSSPNRYLMDAMARLGRGATAYLSLDEDATKVMDRFLQRITHPALTDLRIDWGGAQVYEVYPKRPGDLFLGRSLSLIGRYRGQGKHVIRVRGRVGAQQVELPIQIDLDPPPNESTTLETLWARSKVGHLMDRMLRQPEISLERTIRHVALDYNLMSPYTAFLTVDATEARWARPARTVTIPVPVPAGMSTDEELP